MLSACLPALPTPGRRLRLFCFHHAGGAASVYSGWPAAAPPGVDVLPVQLPGRESRRREAVPPDLTTLVAELDAELAGQLRPPYALYGHSMGGAVAYRLARRCAARGAGPVALLIGACPAPHLRSALQAAHEAGEEELVAAMLRIGGLSAQLLRYPEWRRAATDLLRTDLRVLATEPRPGREALDVPIHLFRGTGDPLVSEEQMRAWAPYTTAGCVLHRVAGGHFFVRAPGAGFFRTLADVTSRPEPSMSSSEGNA
jgi:surfactin synthase thioesterase subunit